MVINQPTTYFTAGAKADKGTVANPAALTAIKYMNTANNKAIMCCTSCLKKAETDSDMRWDGGDIWVANIQDQKEEPISEPEVFCKT